MTPPRITTWQQRAQRVPGDRTVHASGPDMEVVRYGRAGKWYLEPTIEGVPRQQVSIAEAVAYTKWLWANGGSPHFGRWGGSRFDQLLRKESK